jgi:hypothetical protein
VDGFIIMVLREPWISLKNRILYTPYLSADR